MKKIILSVSLFLLCACGTLSAQVTKSTFEALMTKSGTSWNMIQKLYVGNTVDSFEDGHVERGTSGYSASKGNSFSLIESGLVISSSLGTAEASVTFFPFDKIKNIHIEQDLIIITLVD
jgi:hypothetical protein